MRCLKPRFAAFLFALVLLAGCTKDDPRTEPIIDWTAALLTDFRLTEVNYTGINLVHPSLNNGVEVRRGVIEVVVPASVPDLRLTPEVANFTSNDFTIAPSLGQVTNFGGGPVTFTIASKAYPSKKIHYDVTITREAAAPTGALITGFRFEKSKNPALAADISAAKIVHGLATMGKVYIFVPEGTPFTALTPTIEHSGTALYYSQDGNGIPGNSTTPYPAAGLSIDFAYPRVFFAVVKSGTTVRTYDVVVDVKNPIKFDNPTITTANVKAGANQFLAAVTSFVNQGNHPVMLAAVTHTNQQPLGTNAIIASGVIPAFGVLPSERAQVNATIRAQTYPVGTYQSMAVFLPKLYQQPEADALMEATGLVIQSTIEP